MPECANDEKPSPRPALDEIEITPEMIEAGIEAMWGYEVFPDNRGGVVEDEWRKAMRAGFLAMIEIQHDSC